MAHNRLQQFKTWIFQPTDIAFLVYVRVLVAGLMTGEFINHLFIGVIEELSEPALNFPFFSWLPPWESVYMLYAHYILTALAGIFVVLGLFYRFSTVVFALGTTSIFLFEQAEYVNHTYLYCLLAWLLCFMPAHRAFSLDVRRGAVSQVGHVAHYWRLLLLFQMAVVYFYAGTAKVNPDWLLAKPLDMWLSYKANRPLIGGLIAHPLTAWVMSYGGMLFDLFIVPLLIWRRSRPYAFGIAIFFHLTNVAIFGIATFPWFSIAMSALFFPPSLLRRFLCRIPYVHLPSFNSSERIYYKDTYKRIAIFLLFLYATVQILVPLRGFLYPYPSSWSEEGHNFSWHMMLRSKQGSLYFRVVDKATQTVYREYPLAYITQGQYKDLIYKPDMILIFVDFLKDKYKNERQISEVEIYAVSNVSWNGRPYVPLVNPDIDLSQEKRGLHHYSWIMPPYKPKEEVN
ncbi:MAG: HTTM domain-containing protein [Bernardetiaceae bacterium]|nr:HTTM domain-containing protein [Bernardetiaceae bacterium]